MTLINFIFFSVGHGKTLSYIFNSILNFKEFKYPNSSLYVSKLNFISKLRPSDKVLTSVQNSS